MGGCLVTLVIWRVAQGDGPLATATLLLAGIALNAIAGAGIGILVYFSNDTELRTLTFWQLGALNGATWKISLITLPISVAGMAILIKLGNHLNALSLGEAEAYHLGVSPETVKRLVVLGSALAVGAGVAAAGSIGFIGLVVPHLLRISVGADHRWLLPASAMGGAILLVLADLAARTIAMPAELPVGILTALLGGPFFMWLLIKQKKEILHA
jgi:iron complex transport system permease protein